MDITDFIQKGFSASAFSGFIRAVRHRRRLLVTFLLLSNASPLWILCRFDEESAMFLVFSFSLQLSVIRSTFDTCQFMFVLTAFCVYMCIFFWLVYYRASTLEKS